MRMQLTHVAPANAVFLLGQHDDGPALGRFVGQRSELRRVRKLALVDAVHGQEFGCLPVAERDRTGLVEQQRIDVARRLHRPAGHGQHVEAHQPVHTGDADGRQKRADRGRNERDEQRDQHDDRNFPTRIGSEARNGSNGQHEDQRHAGKQDVERDLVRCLLPLRSLDQPDHAIEEGRAGRRRDTHLDLVGQHLRAAGDGGTVSARFTDDWCGFACDRGFVYGSDPLDHFAVGGDDLTGLHHDDIPDLEAGRRHQFISLAAVRR